MAISGDFEFVRKWKEMEDDDLKIDLMKARWEIEPAGLQVEAGEMRTFELTDLEGDPEPTWNMVTNFISTFLDVKIFGQSLRLVPEFCSASPRSGDAHARSKDMRRTTA